MSLKENSAVSSIDGIEKTAFDVLREQAGQIGFGEWVVKLIIYNGEVIGFDQEQAPLIKFRAGAGKKK